MRVFFLLGILCFGCAPRCIAAYRYEFTPAIRTAYQSVLNMRFDEATLQIAQIKKADPENLMSYFVENYIDVFRVFIGEKESDYKALAVNESHRLDMLSRGPATSPYRLYTQAHVKLLWAVAGVKFGAYTGAFTRVKDAYALLGKNQKSFPAFMPNNMGLGVLHAAIGNIPDEYKWGVKNIIGLDGTVKQGMGEIEQVLTFARTNAFDFEREAIVMYAFLVLHLNNNTEKAWTVISSSKFDPTTSPLACFAVANVAMRTGRNEKAIDILQKRPTGVAFYPFHYLDYMLGEAKLFRMDTDAGKYFESFLANFKGKNYVKAAYQRLAWSRFVQGDMVGYRKQMELLKTRGSTKIGADQNAAQEAKSGQLPNIFLLKARLMSDGGYFTKAYDYLKGKSVSDFANNKAHALEYGYRMGRIAHQLGKTDEALVYYQQTIAEGSRETYYFACNAALRSGEIYEARKDKIKARERFNLCLSLHPSEHADGLHTLAKAGLQRVK